MEIFHNKATLQKAINIWKAKRQRIAFVPTMGALHAGHMALVEAAKKGAERVVVSIFVNPKQFGPHEDFSRYPRTEEADSTLLTAGGAHGLYAPLVGEIYPDGFATLVQVRGLDEVLCGLFRPGHFDGVATVVAKLLLQVQPHVAYFGEKDFQQLQIIRRMVKDLDIPVEIRGVPIVREADGLAMSSRNRYLNAEERAIAPKMYQVLSDIAAKAGKEKNLLPLAEKGKQALLDAGFTSVDYLEIREEDNLQAVMRPGKKPARVFAAAYIGKTRLIDNVQIIL